MKSVYFQKFLSMISDCLPYPLNRQLSVYVGKTISTKKEELINVLDHCGVQVDNPVSLLNQDTSRNFLQKSKPGDKYKLFMKATHLEQIATDYEQAEEDQRIMKDAIKKQECVSSNGS